MVPNTWVLLVRNTTIVRRGAARSVWRCAVTAPEVPLGAVLGRPGSLASCGDVS